MLTPPSPSSFSPALHHQARPHLIKTRPPLPNGAPPSTRGKQHRASAALRENSNGASCEFDGGAKAGGPTYRSLHRRLCLFGGLVLGSSCGPLDRAWGLEANNAEPQAVKFDRFPDGLRLLTIRAGEGPPPQEGDEVEINFTARLASKQGWFFENTYNSKGPDGFPVPYTFTVGDSSVIAGLDETVRQMSRGGVVRAVIPPALSYQSKSQGPVPREWSNRRRLYSTVFNEVRQANGEGVGSISEEAFAAPPGLSIRLCCDADAACEQTVARIVETVNDAYMFGEKGLWRDGTASRTSPDEVTGLLKAGKLLLLVKQSSGDVVGSVMVEGGVPTSSGGEQMGELGMLNVAEAHRRGGGGRALVIAAEDMCRAKGCLSIRLQLLTPRDFTHPNKVWLERWYQVLGYEKRGPGQDFGVEYPHIQPLLSCSCILTDYVKALV